VREINIIYNQINVLGIRKYDKTSVKCWINVQFLTYVKNFLKNQFQNYY